MKIKKGFVKNNLIAMIATLIIAVIAIMNKDLLLIVASVIFIALLIYRYVKYDEIEQAANDWWRYLSKDDKTKIKNKGME